MTTLNRNTWLGRHCTAKRIRPGAKWSRLDRGMCWCWWSAERVFSYRWYSCCFHRRCTPGIGGNWWLGRGRRAPWVDLGLGGCNLGWLSRRWCTPWVSAKWIWLSLEWCWCRLDGCYLILALDNFQSNLPPHGLNSDGGFWCWGWGWAAGWQISDENYSKIERL